MPMPILQYLPILLQHLAADSAILKLIKQGVKDSPRVCVRHRWKALKIRKIVKTIAELEINVNVDNYQRKHL